MLTDLQRKQLADGVKLARYRCACRNDVQTGQHLTESEVDKISAALLLCAREIYETQNQPVNPKLIEMTREQLISLGRRQMSRHGACWIDREPCDECKVSWALIAQSQMAAGLVEALRWSMDTLDICDERIANIEGPELAYSPTQVKAKAMARAAIAAYESNQERR